MTTSLNYSLPITSTLPGNCPPIGKDFSKVSSVLDILFQAFGQVKALFVRYCGVSPMPVSMWSQLAGGSSTLTIAGNLTRFYCVAASNITTGHIINLVAVGGVLQAQHANSATGLAGDGFAPRSVTAGQIGEFILKRGVLTPGGAVIVGQNYWLGNAGNVRTTPLTALGDVEQYLGKGITVTDIYIDSTSWIQH